MSEEQEYQDQQAATAAISLNLQVLPVYPALPPNTDTQIHYDANWITNDFVPASTSEIIEKANELRIMIIKFCVESGFNLSNGMNLYDLLNQPELTIWLFNLKYRHEHALAAFTISISFDNEYYAKSGKVHFIIEMTRILFGNLLPFENAKNLFELELIISQLIQDYESVRTERARVAAFNRPSPWGANAQDREAKRIVAAAKAKVLKAEEKKARRDFVAAGTPITLKIELMDGKILEITISSKASVSDLMNLVHEKLKKDMLITISIQRMRFMIFASEATASASASDSEDTVSSSSTSTTSTSTDTDAYTFIQLETASILESYGNLNNKKVQLLFLDADPDVYLIDDVRGILVRLNNNIYDVDAFKALINACDYPLAIREMLSNGVIELMNRHILAKSDDLIGRVPTIFLKLMCTPGFAVEARERAQVVGVPIKMLELILHTNDPYILSEASHAFVAIGIEFLNSQAVENPEFRDLVIQVIQKLRTHWDPEIRELGDQISKSL